MTLEDDDIGFIRSLTHDIELLQDLEQSYREEAEIKELLVDAEKQIVSALEEGTPDSPAIARRLLQKLFGI
jgi:hypothetical protein